jgi:hypothetical protein
MADSGVEGKKEGWTPGEKCGTNLLLHLSGDPAGTSVTRHSFRHEAVVADTERETIGDGFGSSQQTAAVRLKREHL